MKPSYFNLYIQNYPGNGQTLVYNTRTQAMAVFENDLACLLENNTGIILKLQEKEFGSLIEEGFCVYDHEDERAILEDWFNEVCYSRDVLSATILTTYRCNFNCPYCFEQKAEKHSQDMSQEMAGKVFHWLFEKAREKKVRAIHLFYYGGEPLLNKKIIRYLSVLMKDFADLYHIDFKFGIVTNGYLIDAADTKDLKTLGLDFYRITLDGSEKWHDQTRRLKNGKGSFARIMENIEKNTDGVKILISGNFTEKNFPGILDLIDYLGTHPAKSRIHSLSFSPLVEIMDASCQFDTTHCFKNYESEFSRIALTIQESLKKRGFKTTRDKIGMQTCPFKIKDTDVVITPEGDIYKCPVTLGNKDFCVGHVSSLELNEKNKSIIANDSWKRCYPCPYLPICCGGCYYKALVHHGDLFAIDCPKLFFEDSLPLIIKEEYEKLSLEACASSL
ncbi:MAG: radical SAM protein [Candidatus Aureabacteria bacterium]|nr:radical SAM protein [Candidatus Auribacterota bacterium]